MEGDPNRAQAAAPGTTSTGHLAFAFAHAAQRYWLTVFPRVTRELRHWRRRALQIPDPTLRRQAATTHATKSAHCEGAAAFAILAPPRRRAKVVRASVAYQAMYDYLDTISERGRSGTDLLRDNHQLHQALVTAVDPAGEHVDYYALHPQRADGGYVYELAETCRRACHDLPAYGIVEQALRRNTLRAVDSQALTHSASPSRDGRPDALARWAVGQIPRDAGLRWWEIAAAAGSSLVIHALIATAANPLSTPEGTRAVEQLYWPWAGALQGLLDSLTDQAEDLSAGNVALIAEYESESEAGDRLERLARQAASLALHAPGGLDHPVVLAGMVGMYMSSLTQAGSQTATDRLLQAIGPLGPPALAAFRLRLYADRLAVALTRPSGSSAPCRYRTRSGLPTAAPDEDNLRANP